jgi:hypothetical protein
LRAEIDDVELGSMRGHGRGPAEPERDEEQRDYTQRYANHGLTQADDER